MAACAFSYRAERSLSQRIPVAQWSTLWVELGWAPRSVVQAPSGEDALWLEATISALGGTQGVAVEHANAAEVVTEDLGDTLRLFTSWPSDSEGLIEFQTDTLVIPQGKPLSLVAARGDIDFSGLSADLDLDLGVGSVRVVDAAADLSLKTGRGHVQVATQAGLEANTYAVDVHTGFGNVEVLQGGSGAIYAESHFGDVEISVPSDANLDIYVLGTRGVHVSTDQVSLDEPYGEWTETLGDGTQSLVAIAYDGAVTIHQAE